MKFSTSSLLAVVALSATKQSNAFSMQQHQWSHQASSFGLRTPSTSSSQQATIMRSPFSNRPNAVTSLQASPAGTTLSEAGSEVQRLKSMAAKLRAEAADLESQQANERAKTTEMAFRQFDANNDGEVTTDEFKAALEKTFKMKLSEDRVEKLMKDFDKSGDGKLQMEEFVGVEQFRNRLEFLAQDEQRKALDAAKVAAKETEVSQLIESQLELINDKPPTGTDKIVSILPYLFPLMDGVMYGQFLLQGSENNPAVAGLAALYTIYRSIPFSGFLGFFALSSLSNNLSINRQVRYNAQQAIYLDIALFIPVVLGAITTAASSGLNLQLPPGIGELGSDAVFATLLATLAYATISSLFGATPDKLPFISKAVNKRMPSIDVSMFDAEGQFDPSKLVDDGKDYNNDNNQKKD